jgi:GAF domain-containing protein
MGHRHPASVAPKGHESAALKPRSFGGARRRLDPARADPAGAPAPDILGSILRSAADLLGADQGFIVVCRGDTVLEIACARRMRPGDVMDALLGRCAQATQMALRRRVATCADAHGAPMPMEDGFFEANAPAILCLPLDLGMREGGVLCLLRKRKARRVNDLDWEILQALTEQASLAIGAASHQTALSRLEASLAAVPA